MSEHLTELAYDRLRLESREDDPAFFAATEAHLATCAACRAAAEERRSEDDAFAVAPALRVRAAAARARRSGSRWVIGVGVTATLAAGVAIAVRGSPDPEPDGYLVRGGALDFEVHAKGAGPSRLVADGARVAPGERLGFAISAREAGYVLVFGWDDAGAIWSAWPDGPAAGAVPATTRPAPLDAAVELDDTPGREHVAAIWCAAPFALGELVPAGPVDADSLARAVAADPRRCAMRSLALEKPVAP